MLHALFQVVWTEMCAGSVCTQPPYNDKNLAVFFCFFYPFLKLSCLSVWRHTDGGPSHDCWLTVVLAQTALVFYLRPALSELSSVVSPPEQM